MTEMAGDGIRKLADAPSACVALPRPARL